MYMCREKQNNDKDILHYVKLSKDNQFQMSNHPCRLSHLRI